MPPLNHEIESRKHESSKTRKEKQKQFMGGGEFKQNQEEKHEFEDLSRKIIGCAIEVHKTLGPGFLENIYEQAFKIALTRSAIQFEAQKEVEIEFLGCKVGCHRLDLLVEDSIIVELKAARELSDICFAQLRSYLKATGLKVGLLFNFSKPVLEIKRIIN